MFVLKVFVIKCLAINPDELFTKFSVKFPIEHVRYCITRGASCAVVKQLYNISVEKHRLKLWDNREVLEPHPRLARFVISRLSAVREGAELEVFIWTGEAAADFWTAV